ncbi:MAG: hypothetical protein PHV05_06660, partial [Candidatus Riflebacteria bacterium]|nr:hypothetical protein [Candidatus Riflebacteria bacterium]
LKKANSAAYRFKDFARIAEYLGIDRRTLYIWRKDEQFSSALQAGWKRRERQGWREAGFDADETEAGFAELDAMLGDDFKPLEEKPGYVIEHEIIHYPDGSTREIWTQIPEPLPSLKDMQKGMRRKNGRYIF